MIYFLILDFQVNFKINEKDKKYNDLIPFFLT